VLVRVAPWAALGSALKEAARVRRAVFTMALPGDTQCVRGAGVIERISTPHSAVVLKAARWSGPSEMRGSQLIGLNLITRHRGQ
jgi:hypothetical protein